MNLDTAGIEPPATPEYVVDATTFALRVDQAGNQSHYAVNVTQLSHPGLRYIWVHACGVGLRLSGAMAMERAVTPKEKWAEPYYDDMMLEWLAEEEEEALQHHNSRNPNTMTTSTSTAQRASPLIDFLTQPGRYVPMFIAITEHLGPADIVNLRAASQDPGNVYSTLINTEWNINTALQKGFRTS
ncbi:uncharacterized protein BDZ99DRAFT_514061 [Mytilinidion resinicola]|uniref:Uncharacterized protein n=1 Tax=Mytilinidion resinicola TaxID=574789 RepID=A0A6A6ZC88_9PEZI|nr:uncharacterized protein BDZ99DRAFT_514061 [Mytilinidion resinicola]KAF2817847.1 hypothetical protein BDZ99DRAFT_514061 [Mytilinidion resinicola]